jgi:hypothetical protein
MYINIVTENEKYSVHNNLKVTIHPSIIHVLYFKIWHSSWRPHDLMYSKDPYESVFYLKSGGNPGKQLL